MSPQGAVREDLEALTVNEVREHLKIGKTKVYELINEGRLASLKIGRSTRIPVPALRDFITEHTRWGPSA